MASFLSSYFLIATLPPYIAQLGGRESDVGLIMGAFTITALMVRPFVGLGSDRWGPKRMLMIGAVLMAVTPVLYTLSDALWALLVARILHGVGWALAGTAVYVLVAEIAPATRRGEAIGFSGAAGNAAIAIGPAVSVFLWQAVGFSVVFAASVATAVICLFLSLGIREHWRAEPHAPSSPGRLRIIERKVLFPSVVMFLLTLTYGSVVSFLPLFAAERGIDNPGLFFTVYAIVVVVVRGFAGRLLDKCGRAALITPGCIMAAVGLVLLSQTNGMVMFLMAAAVYGGAFAVLTPTLQALAIDYVDPGSRGAAMGTFSSAIDLGIGGGSAVWGFVVQATSYQTLYLIGTFVALLSLVIFRLGSARKAAAHEPAHTMR